jgi:hypothetical protein
MVGFVCVKYEAGASDSGGAWRFFRRWRSTGSDDAALREAVIESGNLYGGATGVAWRVLPELPPVRPEHVDRWAQGVNEWIGYVPSERLRAVFDGNDSLPMETVVPRLQQLLLEPQSR